MSNRIWTSVGALSCAALFCAASCQEFERTVKNMPPFTSYFELARAYADGAWLQTSVIMSREQLERFASDPMFSGLFLSPPKTDLVVADQ